MDPSTNEYVKTREKTERKQDADDECDKSSPTFVEKPSSRRVSFASMNFIKQFAIDPEKNTIWDATYEEMLTLDSTHSSENVHGTLSARQTGSYNSDIRKEHVGDAEDFQLDLNLPNIWMDKENISFPNNSQTQKEIEKDVDEVLARLAVLGSDQGPRPPASLSEAREPSYRAICSTVRGRPV
ncbi:uncharacterized protein LOC116169166 [Photinus pyralis]|uniref:uncharacterized protein LOC116169166 n=1 Tax=Photinus pyralis TaxID=7054 RepID=UPI0012674875|nr:uncharacterized protein LOC116169166 [Photinus pyralis]